MSKLLSRAALVPLTCLAVLAVGVGVVVVDLSVYLAYRVGWVCDLLAYGERKW